MHRTIRSFYVAAAVAGLLVLVGGLAGGPADRPGGAREAFAQESTLSASDGWYVAQRIDHKTWALTEPESHMRTVSYMLVGTERAVLFDSGAPGHDITFIAHSVTDRPITVTASHVHADHIGNIDRFDHVAMPDLPVHRANVDNNLYEVPLSMSLDPRAPDFKVTEWWKPGVPIDLGGRTIEVVPVPGHSPDSVALVDVEARRIFVGDLFYGGDLTAYTPGADLDAWLRSTNLLLDRFPDVDAFFGGHEDWRGMPRSRLRALADALRSIRAGRAEGSRPWWSAFLLVRHPFDGFAVLAWH